LKTAAFLNDLRRSGVELRAMGNRLHCNAPRGVLTPALRAVLSERKEEILAILLKDEAAPRSSLSKMRHIDASALENADSYVRHVNPYLGQLLCQLNMDKHFVRGERCFLYDREGERYIDCIAQYGALPFGYNPPEIWEALEQLRKVQWPNLVQPSVLTKAGELAQRLVQIAPRGLSHVTFANSGAEAVEIAIKLCRSATGRKGILATRNSFHGKTLGALSATGNRRYQAAFGAPIDGFDHIPFGDIDALRTALTDKKGYYAAFIIEVIQGEGGMVEPPVGYLAQVSEVCRKMDTLLVIDEVQTGLGRLGTMFACDHERITPDVLTLAKALGGGLMPIGACLCNAKVYNEEFAFQHSSTFAGNALACQAGLAALDLLEKDDQSIVRTVAKNGAALKRALVNLKEKHPEVVKSIRGKGYMLGMQLNFEGFSRKPGLLGYFAEQEVLSYLIASYMLNVEKIRIAPTASAADVLRIEPPLVAQWRECEALIGALDRTLDILSNRNSACLLGHLIGVEVNSDSFVSRTEASGKADDPGQRPVPESRVDEKEGRFAFLVHLKDISDSVNFDPSMHVFSEEQIAELKNRLLGFLDPIPIGAIAFESRTGQKVYGEFIMVNYTARELMGMPYERARAEITFAIEVAKSRGARIVGLGGFTSVATQGGLALMDDGCLPLTTGNSYTAATGKKAVEMACKRRNKDLSTSIAAVVGATGAVGCAISILLSQDVSRIILIGKPDDYPERSRRRLLDVAAIILLHLWEDHVRQGKKFVRGTLGSRLVSMASKVPSHPTHADFERLAEEIEQRFGDITITTDLTRFLPQADVVVTATNSVESLIRAENLKQNAIVCELSLPFNVSREAKSHRPDVLFIEGGLVHIPGSPPLGFDLGLGHDEGIILACMAETLLLALERSYQNTSLGVKLDIATIEKLDVLGEKHGFSVVC